MVKRWAAAAVFVLLLALGGFIAGGCGSATQSGTEDGKLRIRVGYFPNITHAQALVGSAEGTFQKKLGSKVIIEERNFNAGPSEIEALLAGEIDLGYIGPVPAINGFVKSGGGLKIIAGACDAGAVLVAAKGSGIKTAADLDGKKVAIPQLGNTQDISLRNLLKQAGLKDIAKGGTVTVLPVENPNILTLISKGEIDAALVPEPWASRMIQLANAEVVLDANKVWREGKYATAVVIVSSKFLAEHPDLVKKWLAAHVEVTEQINTDMEDSKTTANEQIKKLTQKSLPKEVLDSSFNRLIVTYNPEVESVREFIDLSAENGYIKEKPDTGSLFDLSLLNQVLAEKGLEKIK